MRLFIGLPVAAAARAELAGRLDVCRARLDPAVGAGIRWVEPDALHVTLRFLGSTEASRLVDLRRAIEAAATLSAPFGVAVAGASLIGSRHSPTVVCELVEGGDESRALERALSVALDDRGWPPEARPFRPHLTIARVRRRGDPRAAAGTIVDRFPDGRIGWRAERVVLFESVLGSGPATYHGLAEARLGA
jgi:2'-5' RNA ligase